MRIGHAEGASCTEAEVRQIVGPDGASALVGIVRGGWKDYLAEERIRTRSGRAMIVWEYMVARASVELADAFDGVRPVNVGGMPAFVLRERILVRFKKHDRMLRTSNVQTKAQTAVARQGYFDGMPGLAYVTCGYVLDKAEAGIERCVIVRSRHGSKWSIDLRELAAGQLAPVQPILPGTEQAHELAPLPSIARRAKDDESGGQ
jgi:hypothetical protein